VQEHFERFAARAASAGVEARLLQRPFPDAFADLAAEGVSAQVVILDVGVSSMQLDQPERGFAYSYDAPLDMRMDQSGGDSAADLLNACPEAELVRILREYGEERFARRIARSIVQRRAEQPFARTGQLVDVVRASIPARAREKGGHPAKRTFQALRVAVNDELGMLDRGLDAALELLEPGGRLLVISFHSLEDRIVKQRFESWTGKCTCPPGLPVCRCGAVAKVSVPHRRGYVAGPEELAENPRAASARLRVAVKMEGGE
jgi:16S rRNA (cytosine1402-N4)-methyltransferase